MSFSRKIPNSLTWQSVLLPKEQKKKISLDHGVSLVPSNYYFVVAGKHVFASAIPKSGSSNTFLTPSPTQVTTPFSLLPKIMKVILIAMVITNHILTPPLTRSLWVFLNAQARLRHICIFKVITMPVTGQTLIKCSLNRKLSLLNNTHVVDSDGSVFMDRLDVAWGQPQQTHSSHYFQNSLQYPTLNRWETNLYRVKKKITQ